jgi:hypothetical protein
MDGRNDNIKFQFKDLKERPLERLRYKQELKIKLYLKGIWCEGGDWIQLDGDRM